MGPTGLFLVTNTSMSISTYIKETRAELQHVSWPSRTQAITYTILVIGVSLLTSLLLAIFDYGFSYLLKTFIVH